jgi:hypothetical protein
VNEAAGQSWDVLSLSTVWTRSKRFNASIPRSASDALTGRPPKDVEEIMEDEKCRHKNHNDAEMNN